MDLTDLNDKLKLLKLESGKFDIFSLEQAVSFLQKTKIIYEKIHNNYPFNMSEIIMSLPSSIMMITPLSPLMFKNEEIYIESVTVENILHEQNLPQHIMLQIKLVLDSILFVITNGTNEDGASIFKIFQNVWACINIYKLCPIFHDLHINKMLQHFSGVLLESLSNFDQMNFCKRVLICNVAHNIIVAVGVCKTVLQELRIQLINIYECCKNNQPMTAACVELMLHFLMIAKIFMVFGVGDPNCISGFKEVNVILKNLANCLNLPPHVKPLLTEIIVLCDFMN